MTETGNAPHRLLELFLSLSEIPLQVESADDAAQHLVELGQQTMGSRICTLARVNMEKRELTTVACAGCSSDERTHLLKRTISFEHVGDSAMIDPERVARGEIVALYDLQRDGQGVANPHAAARLGFHSLLSCPLKSGDQLLGYFNHFSAQNRPFLDNEIHLIELFARQAAVALSVVDTMTKANSQSQLVHLNRILLDLTGERDIDRLLEKVLESGLQLVNSTRGCISRLNDETNTLTIVAHRGQPQSTPELALGQGITGLALEMGTPVRVDDVESNEHSDHYVEFWPDSRSELAVPIVVQNAEVRIGQDVKLRRKRIGVFNVESTEPHAFSGFAEELLVPLAGQTALLIDRLDLDQKRASLAEVQQELVGVRDWDEIIEIMVNAITNNLGFSFVNISLVDRDRNHIKTEYVVGVPPGKVEEFKRRADHPLDSNDIQADIVRTRRIEVPNANDPRFDQGIFEDFQHRNLIRVFVPMIAPSDNRVIGTVEAGYLREKRGFLYEQDIQVLKGFVDYAVPALEKRQRGLIDRISHELLSPIVGVRNNASFLQRRFKTLDEAVVNLKCDDILMDCEILIHQVEELDFVLGRPARPPQIQKTLIFRDVIVKTVQQLKPMVLAYKFNPDHIYYEPSDIHKVSPLFLDKAQINQVIYNLLINAIKYSRDEPDQFTIKISAERRRDSFVISVKDWGIGIEAQDSHLVFDEGFRTLEARRKDVTGSGLGLTIARKIMRAMGGDLVLVRNRRPTEFQMIIPRFLTDRSAAEEHYATNGR